MSVRQSILTATAWIVLGMADLASAAIEVVELRSDDTDIPLAAVTRFAADPGLTATVEDQFRDLGSERFQPLPRDNASFGFVDEAYWFHVRLLNRDARMQRRILALDYALLDQIDVYLRHADGSFEHFVSGDFHPFGERFLQFSAPNFLLDFDASEQADLFVRVYSKSSMQVPLTLYTHQAFFDSMRIVQLGIGVYYGILLALLLYNLILFASLRDANYFYYVLYIAAFGLAQLALNGLAFEYFWPDSPWLANTIVPVSMALGMLLMHQFVRAFLDLKHRLPAADRIILGLMGFHIVMLVLAFLIDYRTAVIIGTAAVFPGAAMILGVSLILARRGDRAARILLLAWAVMLIGTTLYAMVSFGVLPKIFITEYGMQIGSALEMILLSFALAWRFASLRNENIRIVQTARSELEVRVDERTQELSSTLNELARVNHRLRESSFRDGLTGVYNRRYFDTVFDTMLAASKEAGQAFGVLVADIDHFKRVNDDAGHLAGDDCLRLTATTIEGVVGDRGRVVRYGGEEFVVLVPDTDRDSLFAMAESIRQAIAETEQCVTGSDLSLTISIGAALAPAATTMSSMSLLQSADEAMYRAKREGRNRVALA
ncbi:MAG TPA: diguanylate cyclase [Dokdonella sp.]|uniref:sensor domain-containing diguanylate cyclase n=1 Tax=Dokdonella sp. TaxID=2291710 RepID=UPI002D7F3291|nr:diguanylate cyclase [Dokdonella sp.]HET9032291.1 diguanylate cyclase [Dokdonella sp.]